MEEDRLADNEPLIKYDFRAAAKSLTTWAPTLVAGFIVGAAARWALTGAVCAVAGPAIPYLAVTVGAGAVVGSGMRLYNYSRMTDDWKEKNPEWKKDAVVSGMLWGGGGAFVGWFALNELLPCAQKIIENPVVVPVNATETVAPVATFPAGNVSATQEIITKSNNLTAHAGNAIFHDCNTTHCGCNDNAGLPGIKCNCSDGGDTLPDTPPYIPPPPVTTAVPTTVPTTIIPTTTIPPTPEPTTCEAPKLPCAPSCGCGGACIAETTCGQVQGFRDGARVCFDSWPMGADPRTVACVQTLPSGEIQIDRTEIFGGNATTCHQNTVCTDSSVNIFGIKLPLGDMTIHCETTTTCGNETVVKDGCGTMTLLPKGCEVKTPLTTQPFSAETCGNTAQEAVCESKSPWDSVTDSTAKHADDYLKSPDKDLKNPDKPHVTPIPTIPEIPTTPIINYIKLELMHFFR